VIAGLGGCSVARLESPAILPPFDSKQSVTYERYHT
jgi:hypothetical protein